MLRDRVGAGAPSRHRHPGLPLTGISVFTGIWVARLVS
jgi:hypothetical protein